MKKSGVIFYLFAIIVVVYAIIVKIFFLSKCNLTNIVFWIISLCTFLILFRIRKNNNYLKKNTLRLTIISLLSYFLIIYALGLVLGFTKNFFDLSIKGILLNILPILTVIISQEIIRYLTAVNTTLNRKPLYIVSISYVLYTVIFNIDISRLFIIEYDFIFFCTIVAVAVARELLFTYLSANANVMPNILIRLLLELYIFILPIIPNFGNYLSSVFGIGYPAFVYYLVRKGVSYYNKEKSYVGRASFNFLLIPMILFLIVVISLTSGLFKYQMVAIMSDSMVPIFYRGDAILYQKTNDLKNIEVGTVIAFKVNDILVTHRVIEKEEISGKYYFYTKGDNNNTVDNVKITEENVKGIVIFRVPYIGFPTVWLNEIIN